MFWSFSTASPRHSITAMDIPIAQLAALNAAASSPIPGAQSSFDGPPETPVTERRMLVPESSHTKLPPLSSESTGDNKHPPNTRDDPTSPSAILLRQRFSAQRQANYSTSSSGTNGTGCLNTCSSTDSSMELGNLLMTEGALPMSRRQTTNLSPLPRFAISSCDQPPSASQAQARRATLSADPEIAKTSSSSPNAAKRTESLRVFIPPQQTGTGGPEKSNSQSSIYYHAHPQPSPDCQSRSSLSSIDANSPLPPNPPTSPIPPTVSTSSAVAQQTGGQIHPISTTVGKPIVIKQVSIRGGI